MSTRGVVYVHSSPPAVCPHIEWAVSGALGSPVTLRWTAQPATPGQLRAECTWVGPPGTGATITAAVKAWPMVRFEITEEPSPGVDGERFCFVPGLGLWRGRTSANGDIVVGEDQLRTLFGSVRPAATADELTHRLDELLGSAWDHALEPYRLAGDGAPVTPLHRVG